MIDNVVAGRFGLALILLAIALCAAWHAGSVRRSRRLAGARGDLPPRECLTPTYCREAGDCRLAAHGGRKCR